MQRGEVWQVVLPVVSEEILTAILKELQNLTGIPSDDTGNRLESNVADDDSPPFNSQPAEG